MVRVKVAITLEQETLRQVDSLAAECAKLDPMFEQTLAEEGLGADCTMPPKNQQAKPATRY